MKEENKLHLRTSNFKSFKKQNLRKSLIIVQLPRNSSNPLKKRENRTRSTRRRKKSWRPREARLYPSDKQSFVSRRNKMRLYEHLKEFKERRLPKKLSKKLRSAGRRTKTLIFLTRVSFFKEKAKLSFSKGNSRVLLLLIS